MPNSWIFVNLETLFIIECHVCLNMVHIADPSLCRILGFQNWEFIPFPQRERALETAKIFYCIWGLLNK